MYMWSARHHQADDWHTGRCEACAGTYLARPAMNAAEVVCRTFARQAIGSHLGALALLGGWAAANLGSVSG